jgi:hypothetical protein
VENDLKAVKIQASSAQHAQSSASSSSLADIKAAKSQSLLETKLQKVD